MLRKLIVAALSALLASLPALSALADSAWD
jgi:hypothetical protein